MRIEGTLLNIIFRNEENGYMVANFNVNGTLITAVGFFPSMSEGEDVEMTGEFVVNTKYGEQFRADSVRFCEPTDTKSILNFLASGLIKGVGEKTAALIVDAFGADSLGILEHSPFRLTEISGIGAKRAKQISDSYQATGAIRKAVIFLQEHNVPMGLIIKICNTYGEDTVSSVQANPYQLVSDIDGVGFLTADKIAASLGISKDSDFRIEAGLTHILKEASYKDGHTCLPEQKLIKDTAKLIDITDEGCLSAAIERLLFRNKFKLYLKPDKEEKVRYIALSNVFSHESGIAAKLLEMQHNASALDINAADEIAHFEEQHNITLHERQKQAILSALNEGTTIITGGPGTGKTTIIKCILNILTARGLKTALAAPTGRAAKRMSEATGREARTIHRLLGTDFSSSGLVFLHDETDPLEEDAIIIDELSMVDVFLFDALLKALKLGARLILVGDKDQLPSVSCGRILGDLIESGFFPVVHLNEIYRQSSDSLIVTNAHKINKGEMPLIDNKSRDFFFEEQTDAEGIAKSVVAMVKERIPGFLGISSAQIQVLAPMKKGEAGVFSLNSKLQAALNPYGKQLTYGDTVFRVGDKVMQNVNNYEIEWQDNYERGKGVFNGDIGYITDIGKDTVTVKMDDDKTVEYPKSELDNIMLSYAASVHKAQGSEFEVVILALGDYNPVIGTRNLVYTALTRAKRMVVIVGSKRVLLRMINNTDTSARYTLLSGLLKEYAQKISLHFSAKKFTDRVSERKAEGEKTKKIIIKGRKNV
ncbi:MAG: ATP-dependent RecD-like DNA helicase [Christensenellales bacterium]|jgi:exodeoxyribonuclease V alpha subunit